MHWHVPQRIAPLCLVLPVALSVACAAEISGTISNTLTITEDSKLAGDVTCTVNLGPCISFGAPGLTLDLNGYSITGTGPRDTNGGCVPVAGSGTEVGILVTGPANRDEVIRGPGVIQRFRGSDIQLTNSTGDTVRGVTVSQSCQSGIFVVGGGDHVIENNVSVRNGAPNNPCGGI